MVSPMKIRVLREAEYRLAPARIQVFRAGSEVNVPKKTAEYLIEQGAAEPLNPPKEA